MNIKQKVKRIVVGGIVIVFTAINFDFDSICGEY
jgi:hypothetical protein